MIALSAAAVQSTRGDAISPCQAITARDRTDRRELAQLELGERKNPWRFRVCSAQASRAEGRLEIRAPTKKRPYLPGPSGGVSMARELRHAHDAPPLFCRRMTMSACFRSSGWEACRSMDDCRRIGLTSAAWTETLACRVSEALAVPTCFSHDLPQSARQHMRGRRTFTDVPIQRMNANLMRVDSASGP